MVLSSVQPSMNPFTKQTIGHKNALNLIYWEMFDTTPNLLVFGSILLFLVDIQAQYDKDATKAGGLYQPVVISGAID